MNNSSGGCSVDQDRVDSSKLLRFGARPYGKYSRLRIAPGAWALTAAVGGLALLMAGCGTPATLHVIAPATAVVGVPFTITVNATIGTSPDTVINSPIQLTSSDSAAIIYPSYYEFSESDAGSHTFVNGVTLKTLGNQTITATVVGAPALTGTAHVTVAAPAP